MNRYKIIYKQKNGIQCTRIIPAKSESEAKAKFLQMSSGLGYTIINISKA
ncbi:MAG: hypothetical protein IJ937_11130 [Treponema sp.]|nr:hypothetical protein [Treponema sp.]